MLLLCSWPEHCLRGKEQRQSSFSSGWFVPLLAADEAAFKNTDTTLEEAWLKGASTRTLQDWREMKGIAHPNKVICQTSARQGLLLSVQRTSTMSTCSK